jgi:peptidoglycan LD-endopeptidase CwlK
MSAPVFPDDVKFAQQMLCSAGCYNGPRDGVWSNDVDHADLAFESLSDTVAKTFGTFDPRSEKCIRTLHPKAQEAARRFLIAARAAGIDARIISGTRTYAEQAALYKIGRPPDTTNRRVTNAKPGESNHNFGIAWDIGIFARGAYVTAEQPYRDAAAFCPPGVEWGGAWKTFPDPPHYQLAVGKPLTDIRAAFESGLPLLAV